MFSVTLMAMVLGLHGGEPPREVKFQGSLVAQADLPGTPPPTPPPAVGLPVERPSVDAVAVQKQIDGLLAARAGITAPTVLLAIGGGLLTASFTLVIVVAIAGPGLSILIAGVFAVLGGLVALVPIITGAVMMNSRVQSRHSTDAKVKLLRQSLQSAPVGMVDPVEGPVLALF